MFLALLQMREVQISQFAAAIPQPSNTARIARPAFLRACSWRLPEAAGFLGREPVPEPHAHLLGTFHTSDPGSEFRAEQASVCGLVGQPSYCSKSAIYRSRCELPTLEENAVAGDHNLVERQSRLGRSPPCRCVKDLAVMGASPLFPPGAAGRSPSTTVVDRGETELIPAFDSGMSWRGIDVVFASGTNAAGAQCRATRAIAMR